MRKSICQQFHQSNVRVCLLLFCLQYFGDQSSDIVRPTARSQQRTALPSEDLDYTRKWVEDAKKNSPPPQHNQVSDTLSISVNN